jgi:hypothetical protein
LNSSSCLDDDKQHPTVDPDNLEARIEFLVVR